MVSLHFMMLKAQVLFKYGLKNSGVCQIINESVGKPETSNFLAHLSRRLTRWAYSILMVRRPSVVIHRHSHFQTWLSLKPVGQSWSNFLCSITGVGNSCLWFWGSLDQNSDFHGNRKPPLTYNGENDASTFLSCFWSDEMTKILHFRTWKSLRPVGQSWSGFMCNIIEGVERLHNVLRQIGVHGNRKPPLTCNGEMMSPTFSRLFLIQSFLYLQVTRTCIKSLTSLFRPDRTTDCR